MAGGLAGWRAGWLTHCLVGWLLACLLTGLIGWLVAGLVVELVAEWVAGLVVWSRLVLGCWVGCSVCLFVGWLVGCPGREGYSYI